MGMLEVQATATARTGAAGAGEPSYVPLSGSLPKTHGTLGEFILTAIGLNWGFLENVKGD